MESNKTKAIELQEKAIEILELAQAMDSRVKTAEDFKNQFAEHFQNLSEKWAQREDTRKRASKRLWAAYFQVLTQIKLEL
jgi:hypothetical protein